MAKYKVLQGFRDTHTKELYVQNTVIEMTEERANEAIENLKKYKGEFLKPLEVAKEVIEETKTNDETDEAETEETEQVIEDDGIDVEDMTVPQLKSALDQVGIKYKANDTKDVLIALLESYENKEEGE